MVVITKYRAAAVFIFFLLMILVARMPQEQTGLTAFENMTNESLDNTSGNAPLMSTTDKIPADEEAGWWKHEGDSTVTCTNNTHTGSENTGSSGDESSNDDKENGSEEIPEFPSIAVPMITIICIAMLSSRK